MSYTAKHTQADGEVLIAVMGCTGVGKSSFINLVSGSNLAVGSNLDSCTSEALYSRPFDIAGRRVRLIDTPGFDDAVVSDFDTLKTIVHELHTLYETGRNLSGILYLHRITDVRVGGNARKNLAVFRKLCGEKFLPNVVLVTTMWSRGIERKYEPREKQLGEHEHLFRPFLEQGVPLLRHYNTEDGANEILGRIVNKSPRPMRIQEELVDEKKALGNTEAAQYLDNEYRERVENHRKELEALREDLKEALLNNESGTENELQKERECLEEQIKKMIDEADHFSSQYAEERQRRGRSESTPSSGTQKNTLLAGRRADAHLQGTVENNTAGGESIADGPIRRSNSTRGRRDEGNGYYPESPYGRQNSDPNAQLLGEQPEHDGTRSLWVLRKFIALLSNVMPYWILRLLSGSRK
ncbi:hypothetical protein NLI96_g5477 [Meripilus lineatus]|uniref:G domain-containing protein n=1 Tax=Meripilus lineatus TaxID=2056292 RepID=A0AAD5V2S8_9APHY|nr:hypothetical protein NLI96_g5477 [Physisporinus lineatus]